MESLLVGIDVGCKRHRVAVGLQDGRLIDQFTAPQSVNTTFYEFLFPHS